ncbi:hypothetical protein K440DRAFT_638169 [Wilcoxina mikolae CBS 423.85]|nr:hypothetical protein K440DRAFT_638169 [Wilcoxina mikolae CBS 423.85]
MIAIHKIEDRRRLHESKETIFTFHNQLVPKEKIERSRKRFSCMEAGPPSPLPYSYKATLPSIGYETPRSHTPDLIDLCSSPKETSMDTNTLETVISYCGVPQTTPELTESQTALINSHMQTIPHQNPQAADFSQTSSATDTTIGFTRSSQETSDNDQYTYLNQLSVDIMEPAANIGEQLRHRNHLECHAEALEKFKMILGTDYPNVGRLLYDISQILERKEGRGNSLEWTQKPEKWFRKALLKEDKQQLVTHIIDGLRDWELLYTLGKRVSQRLQDQTAADIMYSMGAAYYKRWHCQAGDPENAERWFECALEVYDKVLPTENHVDWVMMTACLIGHVCYKKGDCTTAKRWLDWGLARRDSMVDPTPSELLNSSNSFNRAVRTFSKLRDTLADYDVNS